MSTSRNAPVPAHLDFKSIERDLNANISPAKVARKYGLPAGQLSSWWRRNNPAAANGAIAVKITGSPADLEAQLDEAQAAIAAAHARGMTPKSVASGRASTKTETGWQRTNPEDPAVTAPQEWEKQSLNLTFDPTTLEPGRDEAGEQADIAELIKYVTRRKPVARPLPFSGEPRVLTVLLSDWQVGKAEQGSGSAETAARVRADMDLVRRTIKDAKRCGRAYTSICFIGMGDIIEGCDGHYDKQTFSVDLNDREQRRLARQLITYAIDQVVDLGLPISVLAVPGNHGENRKGGKAFTSVDDNTDLEVFECVKEALEQNPGRYGHVTFNLSEEIVLVADIGGVTVAIAHGHQMAGSGHAAPKLEKWWAGQIIGRLAAGAATILFSAHYHHFVCSEATGRTVFQTPANDPGSYWYSVRSGQTSPPGTLMLGVGTGYGPRGWGEVQVVTGVYALAA